MLSVQNYFEELKLFSEQSATLLRLFDDAIFLVSGAAGLIGSYLIDLQIAAKRELGINVRVLACDRNAELLKERFTKECSDAVECHAIDICREALQKARWTMSFMRMRHDIVLRCNRGLNPQANTTW